MAILRPGGLLEERLTESVIGAFYHVHRTLGFGFLEHVYAAALAMELRNRGHRVDRELGVTIWYEGVEIAHQRVDMVVDGKLILEIKAVERLHPDALRQLRNYLRATNIEVGLLLHFGRAASFYRAVYENARKTRPGALDREGKPASTQGTADSADQAEFTET
jgi:GxxExxY protein